MTLLMNKGVTNPDQRDLRLRRPVFIINKEFVKGKVIKSGIVTNFGLRPYSVTGVVSGLGETKINYTEIAINSGMEKNEAKVCIERIFKQMSEDAKEVSIAFVLNLRANPLKWKYPILESS